MDEILRIKSNSNKEGSSKDVPNADYQLRHGNNTMVDKTSNSVKSNPLPEINVKCKKRNNQQILNNIESQQTNSLKTTKTYQTFETESNLQEANDAQQIIYNKNKKKEDILNIESLEEEDIYDNQNNQQTQHKIMKGKVGGNIVIGQKESQFKGIIEQQQQQVIQILSIPKKRKYLDPINLASKSMQSDQQMTPLSAKQHHLNASLHYIDMQPGENPNIHNYFESNEDSSQNNQHSNNNNQALMFKSNTISPVKKTVVGKQFTKKFTQQLDLMHVIEAGGQEELTNSQIINNQGSSSNRNLNKIIKQLEIFESLQSIIIKQEVEQDFDVVCQSPVLYVIYTGEFLINATKYVDKILQQSKAIAKETFVRTVQRCQLQKILWSPAKRYF